MMYESISLKILKQTEKTPNRKALIVENRQYTYSDIDTLSKNISQHLTGALELRRGDVVALLVGRNEWMVIAPLAVLSADCAYMPLDPAYPAERLHFMLRDSNAKLLIADRDLLTKVPNYDGEVLLTEDLPLLQGNDRTIPFPSPESLALLIYTSGSTGTPKGCMIEQRNIACMADAARHAMALDDGDTRVANYAGFSFVPTVQDTFATLVAGGTLYIIPEATRYDFNGVARFINKHRITHIFMTTMVARQFVTMYDCPTLRYVMAGGEKLLPVTPPDGLTLLNGYGSSECCGLIACHAVTSADFDPSVGRSPGLFRFYIVDENGNRVPQGATGELWLSGPQLCRGYLNRPDVTAQAFADNPFNYEHEPGYERVFKTGDFVRTDMHGDLTIVGRRDGLVKIRGYRVELSEVELVIAGYDGIKGVTVQAFDDSNNGTYIVAYITADTAIDAKDVKRFVAAYKPAYMVPKVVMQIAEIPLNSNHKVDRSRLPEPKRETGIGDYLAPVGEKQIRLHHLIAGVLGHDNFGVDTPLSQAGLTSVSAIRLSALLFKHYKEHINASILLNYTLQDIEHEFLSSKWRGAVQYRDLTSAPLTAAQTGVYIDQTAAPGSVLYNLPCRVTFGLEIEAETLRRAVLDVIAKHPLFGAIVDSGGDEPMMVLRHTEPAVDLVTLDEADVPQYARDFVRPFDLATGPLYRACVVTTDVARHLLLDVHHIIFDGSSFELFLTQLCNILDGQPVAAETQGYLDFASQQQKEGDDPHNWHKDYFASLLKDFDHATALPADRRPDTAPGKVDTVTRRIDTERLNAFCRRAGVTPAQVTFAATAYTLARYAGERAAALCSVSSGRSEQAIADTTGMFVNTLPLYVALEAKKTVRDFLWDVRELFHNALSHERYPFAQIAADYGFEAVTAFVYQVGIIGRHQVAGRDVTWERLDVKTPKFRLEVLVENDGWHIEYDDAYYSREYIGSFADSLSTVLDTFLGAQEREMVKVSVVSPAQEKLLQALRSVPGDDVAPFRLFHQALEHHAEATPDRVALIAADRTLTYRDLNCEANRLAHSLIDAGVKTGDRVALLLPRTSRLIIAMFGVMKAGAAYIPCDPEYPEDRVKLILEDSNAQLTITPENAESLLKHDNSTNPLITVSPANLAYLIYTSGSTGRPKGVMLRHGSICNYLFGHPANVFAHAVATDAERVLSVTTISFDAALQDIGTAIYNGKTLVLADESQANDPSALADIISGQHIDMVSGTPSRWLTWLTDDEFCNAIADIKIARAGGEKYPQQLLDRLREVTGARLFNCYGPTEITVASNNAELTHATAITVGRPQLGVVEYIVDSDGNELPPGVVGELYIGGRGVAKGYNNLEEMTRERFIEYRGTRVYKSGDYAKWTPDGEVIILGRTDNQIKLRGLRIELGEIENVILQVTGVKQAVVSIRQIGDMEHLCAYFTADRVIDIAEMKAEISRRLTDYMVPTAYLQLDAMPMTPNGKTDMRRLPEPAMATAGGLTTAPRRLNRLETKLQALVKEVTGVGDIDPDTPLSAAGLTSLSAIRLAILMKKQFDVTLNAKELVKSGTLLTIEDAVLDNMLNRPANDDETTRPLPSAGQRLEAPLSFAQSGVYLECMKNPTEIIYNVPFITHMPAGVQAAKVREAVIDIVKAHRQFGIHFEMRDNEVKQVLDLEQPVEVEVVTLSAAELESRKHSFVAPFNLHKGPLYRFEVIEADGDVYLLGDVHHLIFDGASHDIFNRELAERLSGRDIGAESYTLLDYAVDEQQSDLGDAKAYFDSRMLSCDGATDVPGDLKSTADHGDVRWVYSDIDFEKLNEMCRAAGLTPAAVTLAAVLYTAARYSASRDAYICTISNGRSNVNISDTMGMFVNTLPITATLNDVTVLDFLRAVADDFATTLRHEQYPFSRVAADYGFRPAISFAYQIGVISDVTVGGRPLVTEGLELKVPKFRLDISAATVDGRACFAVGYDDAFYSPTLMQGFADALANVLSHFLDAPESRLRAVPLLSADDSEAVIRLSAGKDLDVDLSKTFANCFTEQAHRAPDRLALSDGDGNTLTYGETERRANVLAHLLIDAGVTPDSFVALALERTVDVPLTVLAVHKAGAAYLPLDLEYPNERLLYMLENSEAPVLVTTRDVLASKRAEGDFTCDNILLLDDVDWNADAPHIDFSRPDGLAYIIYTSGSTGKPKGAMLHHAGLKNFIDSVIDFTRLTPDDRISHHRSFSFDAHIEDMYPILTLGGSLHIMPSRIRKDLQAMYRFILDHEVTGGGYATPMAILMLNNFDLPVRFITAGGDKLAGVKSDTIDIINVYGPTECTDDTNFYVMERGRDYDNIPIGVTIPNCWSFITDLDGNLMPQGVAGELCFAGVQVGRGYWKLPERTAQSFVPCPFVTTDRFGRPVEMYHTGDLCRYNSNGLIEFISRIDNQVKVNGFRIELGEIDSIASQFDGLSEVAAAVKKIGVGQHICLFYTVKEGVAIDAAALKAHMEGSSLASYMVPDVYMSLDEMPHTPSGKINAKALPVPDLSSLTQYVEPRTNTERRLCDIYARLLQLERVGIYDDFFALGGSSLIATRAVIKAVNAGFNITYGDLFKYKTPAALAAFLSGESVEEDETDVLNRQLAEYDYAALDDILARNTLEAFKDGDCHRLGHILLTGATGFLGIHVLRALLQRDDVDDITCLVRGEEQTAAESRLRSMLFYYFDSSFAELFGSRIKVVLGDVTHDFAVDTPVDTVFNCAANVKHFSKGTDIEDVNTGGARRCIDFCLKSGARLVHVSTVSTSGVLIDPADDAVPVFDEQRLWFGQRLGTKYSWSKFVAERDILEAVKTKGLRAKIMRVGNLSARSSDGEFQMNFRTNSFMGRLRIYKMLGSLPFSEYDMPVEFSPIDETALAIILLATTPDDCVIFHPFNHHRELMGDILERLTGLGFDVTAVEEDEHARRMEQAKADPAKAERLAGLLAYVNAAHGRRTVNPDVVNRQTMQVLYRLGFRWDATTRDYIDRMLVAINGLGFFDEPE